MGRARQTVLHHPGVEIPGRQIAGVVQGQIEQAGVNVAAQAGGARGDQRAGQGIGHRQAGHHIDHRQAETAGGVPGSPVTENQPASACIR